MRAISFKDSSGTSASACKNQKISPRGCIGSNVHLPGTAARAAPYNLIAEAFRQPVGAVSAPAIDDNNFRPRRSLAQIRQKSAYRWRFIKDRDNNGDLH